MSRNAFIRVVTTTVLLLTFVGMLQGCQAQQAQAPTAAPETIKLGLSIGVTGASAAAAKIGERFQRMGVEDINAKGGVKVGGKSYRLDLVVSDDKFTSDGGRESANRLVLAEKVKFIVGGSTAPLAGIQPISEPNKVLVVTSGAAPSSLGPSFPHTVVVGNPHESSRYQVLYDWFAKTYPEAKRVVMVIPDALIGRTSAAFAEEVAKSRGLTFVATEAYPLDLKDASPLVTRVLGQRPDVIDVATTPVYGNVFATFARSLNEQGYRKPWIGSLASLPSINLAGPAAEGLSVTSLLDRDASIIAPKEKEIIQRYVSAYGAPELDLLTVHLYNQPWIVAQAIEKAGTVDDTEKIVKVLREGEWDTIQGKMRFTGTKTLGSAQYLEGLVYLSKVEGGKVTSFSAVKGSLP